MAKKKKGKVVQMLTPENYIRQKARSLPLFECFINSDWEENGMANITVARKHSNGNITMGMYLTDLKCLGVKDAHYFFNISEREYRDILKDMEEQMDIETVSYILAHNIIFAGIEFADDYGFKPHKDFTSVAQYILEKDTDDIELIEIECGKEGKPLYVRGPFDSETRANKIIAQLEREAGPGNYDVIWQADENFKEDVWEEEEDSAPIIKKGKESQTCQFKIQINGITHPPVWRRIAVPSNYSFYDFHRIIQEAFGWWSSHLFQFSENGFGSGKVITEIYEDVDADFEEQIDAKEIYLSDVFDKEKQKFVYIYDFGDSWEHTITLEKILPEKTGTPELLAGKGQCPPEDCGGVWGYANFKEIMANKKHPEYEEYAEWVGLEDNEEWDPTQFDLKETQVILREMFRKK
jgi:hypothetical protein